MLCLASKHMVLLANQAIPNWFHHQWSHLFEYSSSLDILFKDVTYEGTNITETWAKPLPIVNILCNTISVYCSMFRPRGIILCSSQYDTPSSIRLSKCSPYNKKYWSKHIPKILSPGFLWTILHISFVHDNTLLLQKS